MITKSLFILVFALIINQESINGENEVIDNQRSNHQVFDEDDDIDPYEDDGEPIHYPIKSVMPERAMTKSGPKILPKEGSGASPPLSKNKRYFSSELAFPETFLQDRDVSKHLYGTPFYKRISSYSSQNHSLSNFVDDDKQIDHKCKRPIKLTRKGEKYPI